MPNEKYKKYLALSKSANGSALLRTIAKGETSETLKSAYYKLNGTAGVVSDLSKKPRGIPKGATSSAAGRYQFTDATWDDAVKALGLTDFSPESQDAAAAWLADQTGAFKELEKGDELSAIYKLGSRWESLPINEEGINMSGKKALFSPTDAKNIFKQNQNFYKNDEKSNKEKNKIKEDFYNEIERIKKLDVEEFEKNQMLNNHYQKTFDDGNLEIINKGIDYQNRKFDEFEKRYPSFEKATPAQRMGKDKESYEFFRNQLRNQNAIGAKGYDNEFIVNANTPNERKSRYNLTNYLEKSQNTSIPATENSTDNSSETGTDNQNTNSVSVIPPEPESKTNPADDLISRFQNTEAFADPQFKYTPGKQEVPWDALVSLGAGLTGIAAADVDIKYRDEKVSEGLLNYAAELEKVKNIGLPPEIEGDLKMKLADAYQTGLTNLVRASNGNRNLVLGNQGQLDAARMKGIVGIATMDMERRDKAMAAYGEVQKYISDFDASRDIANNERKYREDEKKQIAGSQLAMQGMSGLVDALQAQRENGPGSPNDQMKQFLMWHISGVNKDAKPGEPGSQEYIEEMKKKNESKASEKEKGLQRTLKLTPNERMQYSLFLKEQPQFDPVMNPDKYKDDEASEAFKLFTGTKDGEMAFNEKAGTIDSQTNKEINNIFSGNADGTINLTDEQAENKDGYLDGYSDGPMGPVNAMNYNNNSGVTKTNGIQKNRINLPVGIDTKFSDMQMANFLENDKNPSENIIKESSGFSSNYNNKN